jgi:hypothetical protein
MYSSSSSSQGQYVSSFRLSGAEIMHILDRALSLFNPSKFIELTAKTSKEGRSNGVLIKGALINYYLDRLLYLP